MAEVVFVNNLLTNNQTVIVFKIFSEDSHFLLESSFFTKLFLFQQTFYILLHICPRTAGKIFSALKVHAFCKLGQIVSAAAKTTATACAECNQFFAGPVLAFHKSVDDFGCISPPDWIAQNHGVIARNVNFVCDFRAAFGVVAFDCGQGFFVVPV